MTIILFFIYLSKFFFSITKYFSIFFFFLPFLLKRVCVLIGLFEAYDSAVPTNGAPYVTTIPPFAILATRQRGFRERVTFLMLFLSSFNLLLKQKTIRGKYLYCVRGCSITLVSVFVPW